MFSEFIQRTKSDQVVHILVKPKKETVYYVERDGEYHTSTYSDSNEFWRILLESDANINIDNHVETSLNETVSSILSFLILIALLRIFVVQFFGGGGIGRQSSMFMLPKKLDIEDNISTRFSDVEGIDEAKKELEEIVDFLRAPDKYSASGAKIPKGALLIGNPGTGKTLLARAIAGESSVPFIQCSGSSFVEMFVGVGAKRVRDVFEQARKSQPCIIFIDEIDAIGKKRSINNISSNDERDQTINYDIVRKVSIIPRGNTCGTTYFQPKNDDMNIHTKEYLIYQIKVGLAGHAAEEMIYGKTRVSTGASNDFARVFDLAKDMVTIYGFSDIVGKINAPRSELSQQTLYNIDNEIHQIVNRSYNQTVSLLRAHYIQLETMKDKLVEEGTVDGDFVYSLF